MQVWIFQREFFIEKLMSQPCRAFDCDHTPVSDLPMMHSTFLSVPPCLYPTAKSFNVLVFGRSELWTNNRSRLFVECGTSLLDFLSFLNRIKGVHWSHKINSVFSLTIPTTNRIMNMMAPNNHSTLRQACCYGVRRCFISASSSSISNVSTDSIRYTGCLLWPSTRFCDQKCLMRGIAWCHELFSGFFIWCRWIWGMRTSGL